MLGGAVPAEHFLHGLLRVAQLPEDLHGVLPHSGPRRKGSIPIRWERGEGTVTKQELPLGVVNAWINSFSMA